MSHNILDIFSQVVALPVDRRAARLAALCGGDPKVEAAVRAMLAADERADPLLDAPGAVEAALAMDLAETSAPPDDVVPARIGPYTVRRILGSGGMGVVYLAQEEHPRRLVALKVLHADLQTRGYLERFRLEVQTVADLRHPCIPQVFAAGEVDGAPWLAMELIDGVPIHHAAAGRELDDRLRLLITVAETLAAVHQRGVLHCDLKPANVLVTADARPYILDFGLASTTRRARDRAGTPAYMAPEQRAGAQLDARVDVFALGKLARVVCQFGESGPLPSDLSLVLDRATASDKDERYASMAAFVDDLQRVVARRPVAARPRTPAYLLDRLVARHGRALRIGAVAIGALVLIGVGAALLTAQLAQQTQLARERAAAQRLAVLQGRIRVLEDRPDEAAVLLDAFVRLPENQDTSAVSMAWAWWGDRLASLGKPEAAADARGRAYVGATDPALQRAALVAVARSFAGQARWSELAAVLGHLAPWRGDPEVEALWREADGGRRELSGLGPTISRFATGTRLPFRAYRADVSPWRDRAIVLFQQQPRNVMVELSAEPPFSVQREWAVPAEVAHGFSFPRAVHGHDATWVGRTADDRMVLGDAVAGTLHDVEGPALLLSSATTQRGELFVGTGLPHRGLSRVRRQGDRWRADRPSAEVERAGSDVSQVLAADLDGDGTDEVIVAQGPWNVYDVQVLRDGGDALLPDARLQLGFVGGIALLETGAGPRIVALKIDSYPSRLVLGEETPVGRPAGLYVLRWDPGALTVEAFHPLPFANSDLIDVAAGDLDGDGQQDLAVGLGLDGTYALWTLIAGPAGLQSQPALGGLALLGLIDADGDGRDELIVRLAEDDHHTWVLGVGETPLPTVPPPPFEPSSAVGVPSDPAVRRVWDRVGALAAMGLYLPAARALRHAEALNPHPEDGPLLSIQIAEWAVAGGAMDEAREVLQLLDPAAVSDPELRRRAARAALVMRDLGVAAVWLPDPSERRALALELGWSDLPPIPEPYDLLRASTWNVHDPEGVAWTPAGMQLDLFSDGVKPADAAVSWEGGALALEATFDIQDIEFGGAARLTLSPIGAPDLGLSVAVVHGGGGIDTRLTAGCDARPPGLQGVSWPLGRSARVDRRLTVRLLWLDATGRLTCTVRAGDREVFRHELAIDWQPAPGRWRLALEGTSQHRGPTYARSRLLVPALHVEGAVPLPAPPGARPVEVPVTRRLRRDPQMPSPSPEALAAYAVAWGSAVDSLDGVDLAQGMLLPELADLSGETFDERLLMLGRAVVLAQRGEPEAAAALLDVMLGAAERAGDQRWFLVRRAWALRVTLARALGDTEAERRVREAFARSHPDPARASEQLDRLIVAIAPHQGGEAP